MGMESTWQEKPKYFHFPYCKEAVGVRLNCKFSSEKNRPSLLSKKGDKIHLDLVNDYDGRYVEMDMTIDWIYDYPVCMCFHANSIIKSNHGTPAVWLADIYLHKNGHIDKDFVILSRTFKKLD